MSSGPSFGATSASLSCHLVIDFSCREVVLTSSVWSTPGPHSIAKCGPRARNSDKRKPILTCGKALTGRDLFLPRSPLQRRGRRFEPVTAHLVNPLVSACFSNRTDVRRGPFLLTRSAYVPQADSKPCLLCSLQNAVIMHLFTSCGRGREGELPEANSRHRGCGCGSPETSGPED
jgi:hypothetical protein